MFLLYRLRDQFLPNFEAQPSKKIEILDNTHGFKLPTMQSPQGAFLRRIAPLSNPAWRGILTQRAIIQ